jgi:hypothetical protein
MSTSAGGWRVPAEPWIGLAHVKPRQGNDSLRGAKGAYVCVVALAETQAQYARETRSLLNSHSFHVLEILDVEPLQKRQERSALDPEIRQLAESLCPNAPAALHKFHAYDTE